MTFSFSAMGKGNGMRLWVVLCVMCFCVISGAAFADCQNPDTPPGTIVFNDTHNVFQGCTRANKWVAFHDKITCKNGPLGMPCEDGAIYIGNHPLSDARLYVSAVDDGVGIPWGDGSVPFVPTMTYCPSVSGTQTTCANGYENTTLLYNLGTDPAPAPYSAARLCRDKGADWYLPAVQELKIIFDNREHLSGISMSLYWSSSEASVGHAKVIAVGYPDYANQKAQMHRVRCMRR